MADPDAAHADHAPAPDGTRDAAATPGAAVPDAPAPRRPAPEPGDRGWSLPARVLHWAGAALVLFLLGLGLWAAEFSGDDVYRRFALTQLHKSWGIVAFALALARLGWRLVSPPPAPVPGTPAWAAAASRAAHFALYALLLAMPLSGWLMASASEMREAYGIGVSAFGLVELPDPVAPADPALEALFRAVHGWSAAALAGLVAVHAAAALHHHLVARDRVLVRMIRGR